MNHLFADTLYWVALINPRDQWRKVALDVSSTFKQVILVTTDEVLTETLNYFAEARQELRTQAVNEIRAILINQNVVVVSCDHNAVLDAIDLYESRPDKGYSLTDCISMNICRRYRVGGVLTHDDHFSQEGFEVLL